MSVDLASTSYWSQPVPLAELISETLDWNTRNADRAGLRLDAIEHDLPSGSGIDSGTTIDRDCQDPSSAFTLLGSWHAIDSNGYYAGWFDFTVGVTATFAGPVVSIDWPYGSPEQDYDCDCPPEEEEEDEPGDCSQCAHGVAPPCDCEWAGVADPGDYLGDVYREAMREIHARIEYDDPPAPTHRHYAVTGA